jgi:hypothetical protein
MLDEREEEAKRRAHLIRNETRTRRMCKLEDKEKNAFDLIYSLINRKSSSCIFFFKKYLSKSNDDKTGIRSVHRSNQASKLTNSILHEINRLFGN